VVLVTATSDFLLADARAALRRRLAEPDRTDLSRAFAAWVLREPGLAAEFASLVELAASRKGAQQDFQTVAILGYGSEAGILTGEQVEALRKGLRRQAGREPLVDSVPMAFCLDAVGILGVALGVRIIADAKTTSEVVRWAGRFLKTSYEMERTEDWQRCLFAAGDRQLGSPLNLPVPTSAAVADLRTALITRGVLGTVDDTQATVDAEQTLRLAYLEPQADLPGDRAMLRLAAVEFVIRATAPIVTSKAARSVGLGSSLSPRDASVHDVIGKELFNTHTNAEIMKDLKLRKRLLTECKLESGDATKRSIDRIRQAKGYPLSRAVAKKRASRN
jgi:hypothetical protein